MISTILFEIFFTMMTLGPILFVLQLMDSASKIGAPKNSESTIAAIGFFGGILGFVGVFTVLFYVVVN